MTAREASRIVKCFGLLYALFDLAPPVQLPVVSWCLATWFTRDITRSHLPDMRGRS
jgi:hypothetical protein